MLRIENIKVFEDLNNQELYVKALKKAGILQKDVREIKIAKKAIDARDKNNVHYLYSFDVTVLDENKYPKLKRVKPYPGIKVSRNRRSQLSPVIVGAGPAGLFCALTLIDNGYKPIIIEQGDCVENRRKYVEEYREKGILNEMCNVQFGEGGAGTFSDGKLTTGINSPFVGSVLEMFRRFGAPEEITYLSHPHIGTDNLINILINIRNYISSKGGQYFFNTRMTDLVEENGLIRIICEDREFVSDAVVLAIGHSARSSFEMLLKHNVNMKRKNFSVGVSSR